MPVCKLTFILIVTAIFFTPFAESISGELNDIQELEVTFKIGKTKLTGTLYKSADGNIKAALVSLGGSNRSSRGQQGLEIARQFARRGIAALVYDSPPNTIIQTREDRVVEAIAAIDYLRGLPDVNPESVGIHGGSEGADVALIAAAKDKDIAFVIPVSGSIGGSVNDILRYSAEKKGYELGLTVEEITKAITFKEIAFAFLSRLNMVEWRLVESRSQSWDEDFWGEFVSITKLCQHSLTEEQQVVVLGKLRVIVEEVKGESWFQVVDVGDAFQKILLLDVERFFAFLETNSLGEDWDRNLYLYFTEITSPVLGIWGEDDTFLPPNQSELRLKKMLTKLNHPDFQTRVFENASHYLTTPGSTTEFVPGYFDLMADWVKEHVR